MDEAINVENLGKNILFLIKVFLLILLEKWFQRIQKNF